MPEGVEVNVMALDRAPQRADPRPSASPRRAPTGRMVGLDGLRAVAVLGVLLYHAGLAWIPGGFLGVDVFFVLSGFLITGLLWSEVERTCSIDFGRFYLRRARRLLPALFGMLTVVAAFAALFARDAVGELRGDLVASLAYVSNWWQIFHHRSYFEAFGRSPLLQHLWSLAVEEQFYIVWPAVLWLLVRRFGPGRRGRRMLGWVAAGGAVASMGWMALLSARGGMPVPNDPSRVYFGTDSHVFGLMVGAALATVWRPALLPSRLLPSARWVLDGTGTLALAGLGWAYLRVGEFSVGLYRYGFLLFAVVTGLAVAVLTHPAARLGRVLGSQPMRWIGLRSYGIYLWHWPVFMLTRPGDDIPLTGTANLVLRLALTGAIAELSYRYLEVPVREGRLRPWLSGLRRRYAGWGAPGGRAQARAYAAAGAGLLAVAIGAVGLYVVSPPSAQAQGTIEGVPVPVPVISFPGAAPQPASASGRRAALDVPDPPRPTAAPPPAAPAPAPAVPAAAPPPGSGPYQGPVTAFGDSVLLGSSAGLRQVMPAVTIDALVGRQATVLLTDVQAKVAAGQVAPVVVVHTGTNGVISPGTFGTLMQTLADRRLVVVINDRVPRPWEGPNDALLAAQSARYPNLTLVDWYGLSVGHPEWFAKDGVHLTSPGVAAYATAVRQVLAQRLGQ